MSAPWFRTTDLTRWGAANSGGPLTGQQFDENMWWTYTQIVALNARPTPSEIAYFVLVGDQLSVVMTDHSTRGPYTIPTSAFRFRGAWLPDTAYLVNDVFTINGSTYIVLFNHTSASTFSAGANDGLGHNYYGLMLANPGNSLPTGGAVGQMIIKTTTADFAVSWGWPLPTGGTLHQILMKNSNTNQDATWHTPPFIWAPPASPAGLPGQLLATVDGTSTNMEWVNGSSILGFVHAPPASPVGVAGQVLATVDGTATNTEWITPSGGGGSTTFAGLTDVNVSEGPGIDGFVAYWNNAAGYWEAKAPHFRDSRVPTLGSAGAVNLDPSLGDVFEISPAADVTLACTSVAPGANIAVIVNTSGTTSFNITFGSNFKSQGVLATGTVNGKLYVVRFTGDNGSYGLIESSRVGPI